MRVRSTSEGELVMKWFSSSFVNLVVAGACLIATASGLRALTSPADVKTIASLAGRWAGLGNVVPSSGRPLAYKCVVTYRPGKGKIHLRQRLRCKNGKMRLEAATNLHFENGRVTGYWEDKINNMGGRVRGKVTKSGFVVLLASQFFNARMKVVGSKCKQSVVVTPTQRSYIRQLSADLKKC